MNKQTLSKKTIDNYGRLTWVSVSLVFFILLALFIIKGYAPFGIRSLATNDANIQYLDFFLYFKDVLEGKNSISYSFSKLLGGTGIALFSYYLASPLNLLILFFENKQVVSFYNLLVMLKVLMATAAFSVFLRGRFPHAEKTPCYSLEFAELCRILLPVCYGLSQYVLSQSRNIMWLDGVYMLPLILLGVYRVVQGGPLWKLSIPVALSILFNWYTAGMNCLFSAIWFVMEIALQMADRPGKLRFKGFVHCAIRYVASMLLGVLCSSALFLPTISALTGSAKGHLKIWNMFQDRSIRAPIFSIIETTVYGASCSSERVSLYCGVLPLAGVLCLFTKKERLTHRLILTGLLLFVLLMFFWAPLYSVFNLLENPTSHWVRFSYLQIFAVIFVAAWVFLTGAGPNRWGLWGGSLAYIIVLLALHLHFREQQNQHVYLTAAALFLLSIMLFGLLHFSLTRRSRTLYAGLIVLLVVADLGYQTVCITGQYHNSTGKETALYIQEQEKQIRKLREKDASTFRISQTSTRNMGKNRKTANFDESLAYGYWSISHYSSTVDDCQLALLNRLGYKNQANTMSIVNTSILAADSLLGVKYVLSDYSINGLTEADDSFSFGEKKLYENPFALPMAFCCADGEFDEQDLNPFEYQNTLYSSLLGRKISLYLPLEYKKTVFGNSQHYSISLPEGNYAVYGNIEFLQAEGSPVLDLNGKQSILYACWLAPTVFYVPTEYGEREATVTLTGNVMVDDECVPFYALDLGLLEQVTQELRESSKAVDTRIDNGHVSIRVNSKNNSSGNNTLSKLLLTVPVDNGWSITQNGKQVHPELWAELFYCYTLEPGENIIEMSYHVPLLKEGLILSAVGLLVLYLLFLPHLRHKSSFNITQTVRTIRTVCV